MKTQRPTFSRQVFLSSNALLAYLACINFLFLMCASVIGKHWGYGYFVDEFYYLACAKRLAFGYVDHPPLAPFLLRLILWTLGDSLLAIRLLPALAGSATIIVVGLIARQLGAGRFGQFVAALSLSVAPAFLAFSGFFSMNIFESLIWTVCVYIVIRLIQRDQPRLWLLVGGLIGIGLLNKHTLIVYAVSLYIGVLLTPARKYLKNKWFWLGILVAGVLILPNVVWQIQNNLPSVEFYRNAMRENNVASSPIKILWDQILFTNPVTLPVWLIGLYVYLFSKQGKPYRLFGWSYLLLLITMIVVHSGRPDRIFAAYPALFAAGAFLIEQMIKQSRSRVLPSSIIAILILGGIGLLPLSLPILPPTPTINYLQTMGLSVQIEQGTQAELPQWLADRLEWEDLAATVARVYNSLPPEEQSKAVIFAGGFGDASALEFLGEKYELPPVITSNNNYYLWGPGEATGDVVIFLGGSSERLQAVFKDVKQAESLTCDYCRFRGKPVYICKELRTPLPELWPQIKEYR